MHAHLQGNGEGWRAKPIQEKPGLRDDLGSTPALAVPSGPSSIASSYDLTLSHPAVDAAAFASFDRWLVQAASSRGLSCALLHDGVVEEAIRRVNDGRLRIGFHLDYFALWHVAEDPYARLAEAIQDAGGTPVNSPARARVFTDKANMHGELIRHGLGVPPSIIVRPGMGDRALTAGEQSRLRLENNSAVYIKPANGFGGRGVMRVDRADPQHLQAALASARQLDRRDTYLIQREIRCPCLPGDDGVNRPAYWRVLYCFGEVLPFWWNKQEAEYGRPSYRALTEGEIDRHRLGPILDYTRDIAHLSGMDWFSTELCLSTGTESSCHQVRAADGGPRPVVAIDYLNDQCDVDVQSRWIGAPPDRVVRHLAERFAEVALGHRIPLEIHAFPVPPLRAAA